ncbi:sugar phosphate isomerase/epimerase family protein [Anaerosacchariphilus polymeriproducens]|uniref:AP endonuclease n=1 Tax=Anaerosacchariphilus polymeriproducens TaxID=1812858 RepID=A0A371AS12_9FIRM|nr:TIM barrel protein [Anaerosacchariphilus polymeriproducens]RDU22349.1 AP endonuclease [Anaerosacchariphilus polymeriproducens]
MNVKISGAPCCWGVDDPKNPYLPDWKLVLREAGEAGYKGIELGPYGYLPLDEKVVSEELIKNNLTMTAGTIFDDLVSEENIDNLKKAAHDICALITKLPLSDRKEKQHFPTPYLVIIDWGHEERDYESGHPDRAPRLSRQQWDGMMEHIVILAKIAKEYGVRAVIHPHAGGYIEFQDEIEQLVQDIPYEIAGLCLDTGHLYYSKMDPVEFLKKYMDKLDYIHFKDIDFSIYQEVMKERIRFFDACAKGVMCPIGKGVLDYEEINKVIKEIDYEGHITIEQERDPRDVAGSLEAVMESRKFLNSIGF